MPRENSLRQPRESRSAGILRHALNSLRRFERLRMTDISGDAEKKPFCRRLAQINADRKRLPKSPELPKNPKLKTKSSPRRRGGAEKKTLLPQIAEKHRSEEIA